MLGSLILYLKGMRTTMFQLSGFYCMGNAGCMSSTCRVDKDPGFWCQAEAVGPWVWGLTGLMAFWFFGVDDFRACVWGGGGLKENRSCQRTPGLAAESLHLHHAMH